MLILQTLKSIEEVGSVEYNSYVYSTYSSLRMADETGKDHYHALITAYTSTQELLTKLKILLNISSGSSGNWRIMRRFEH